MGWLRRTAEIGMERSPVRPLARDESVRVGASMNRMNRDEKPLYHERGLTRRLLSQGRGQAGLASGKATARSDAAVHARPRQVATTSEKHTSELQSLMRISYAVFCLKKKHTNTRSQLRPL